MIPYKMKMNPPLIHQSDKLVKFNDREDIIFSNSFEEQRDVLHVFHQEWHGIRAAAGAQGGHKIAISANERMTPVNLLKILKYIEDESVKKIVFHAMSESMLQLISYLEKKISAEPLYLIMHGTQVQWSDQRERSLQMMAINLASQNKISKIHFMKAGYETGVKNQFRPIVYNHSPLIDLNLQATSASDDVIALSGGWGNLGKNVHSNVFGAALSPLVKHVWHCASDVMIPSPFNQKLIHLKNTQRKSILAKMQISTLCLNASLFECHPMFNTEAQTLGTPCVRGNLSLDIHEDHEYVKVTSVVDVASVHAIRDTVERIISVPFSEMREMTLDYQRKINASSRQRYREFLEV